jgi:hypothetical protein
MPESLPISLTYDGKDVANGSTPLEEMSFCFNKRKNNYLFSDTMLKLIESPNLEYKQLTVKVQEDAA